ncbi:hypothetical protein MASR2M78_34330 [Treponema sp.]
MLENRGIEGDQKDTLLLSLQAVSLSYSTRSVIHNLNLDIERGNIYAIVGATGCGKTSLLHLLAGLLRPSSGTIQFTQSLDQGRVALIPQDYGLFPWKTVHANARMGLEIQRSHRALPHHYAAHCAARVDELLSQLGIAELAERWPASLSGGQKQRTGIARALAPEPALLLMDEPFSALDADIRESLQDLVRSLPSRFGTTPIFVTHDLHEALRIADRIILFHSTNGSTPFTASCIENTQGRAEELKAMLRDALKASRGLDEK